MSVHDCPLGETFRGSRLHLVRERLLAFSGGPFGTPGWPSKNLHTDHDTATAAGLSAPIASGIQAQSHIIRLMTELFPDTWFTQGELDVRFRAQVHAGDELEAIAKLVSRDTGDNGTRFGFEVSCVRGDGEVVAVGTAACVQTP